MRIAVFTDAYANLPAVEAALAAIREAGCDAVFHTGDAIGIGPYPAETVDLLLSEPTLACVMGNHEAYFVDGLPDPRPAWMSVGEVTHQRWTHRQLGAGRRELVAQWPTMIRRALEGVGTRFLHYGLTASGRDFVRDLHPGIRGLDDTFKGRKGKLIFYGHNHRQSDRQSQTRYVNPGSLGCHTEAVARYCIAEFHRGKYEVAHRGVEYDDAPLHRAFEERDVPERTFIYQAFFGGRFASD